MSEQINSRLFASLTEFLRRFPDERSARRFVERAVWPDGPRCHHCGTDRTVAAGGQPGKKGLRRCLACGRPFTITTNTLLHSTKVPLRLWLLAAHLIVSAPNGMTSVHLATLLGVPQKTAWRMGVVIREMMARALTNRSNSRPRPADADQDECPRVGTHPGEMIGGELGRLVSRLISLAAEKASVADDAWRRTARQTYHRITRRHERAYLAEHDFREHLRRESNKTCHVPSSEMDSLVSLKILFSHIYGQANRDDVQNSSSFHNSSGRRA
jgi:transposase-like protein